MFGSLKARARTLFRHFRSPSASAPVLHTRLSVTHLESRDVPTTMFTVTTGMDSGPGSLRNAFQQATAQGNDTTIIISATVPTITLESPLFTGAPNLTSLTIETAGGAADVVTIMRDPAPTTPAFRFFNHSGNNGLAITLDNLNITGFIAPVTFVGPIMTDNGDGGAIVNNSSLTLNGCTFSANSASGLLMNSATGNGGAIYETQSLTMTGSTFFFNTAFWSGGAVYDTAVNTSADGVTVTSSVFGVTPMGVPAGNEAMNGNGGAIYYLTDAGTLTISGDTTAINNNAAPMGLGGGVYQSGGTISAISSMMALPGTGFNANVDMGAAVVPDGHELYLTGLTQAHIDINVTGPPPGSPPGFLIYLVSQAPPQQPSYWAFVDVPRVFGTIFTNWPIG
jgi:hypothetical protein